MKKTEALRRNMMRIPPHRLALGNLGPLLRNFMTKMHILRTSLLAALMLACSSAHSESQQTSNALAQAGYRITAKGLNHRRWSRPVAQTNENGTVTTRTNHIYELSTGLHRWQTNQSGAATLLLSRPEIVTTTNGLVARGAGHSAWMAPNINTFSALQTKLPSGEVLKSHILGLAYHDTSTGSNVMFAVLQDSTAEVATNGPPRVIYRSAFSDGVDADVIYSYSKAGISQDIRFNAR